MFTIQSILYQYPIGFGYIAGAQIYEQYTHHAMKQTMKKLLFSLFLLSPTLWVSGQFPATFDQDSFLFAPFWQGDTTQFYTVGGVLQLNNPSPASRNDTYLSVFAPTNTDSSTTWSFRVQLDFSPSSTNYAQVYLTSSSADLTDPLNGYFVRIGGISGTDDALELYRQDGLRETLLTSGAAGAVGNGPIAVWVEVTRNTTGNWSMAADYSGGKDPVLEATAVDTTYPEGLYSGLRCFYTATRNTAFGFDDLNVRPLTRDTIPPHLQEVIVQDTTRLLAVFNEPLSAASVTDNTFILTPGLEVVQQRLITPRQIELLLRPPLINATTYTLTAQNVEDLAGNRQNATAHSFDYLVGMVPAPGQLLLTEFFANPSPDLIDLPRAEYLELYNSSAAYLDLSTVRLSSGGTPEALPEYILPPNAYLTLTAPGQAPELSSLGPTLAVPSFPTLSNNGDLILLENEQDQILQHLNYTSNWLTGKAGSGVAALERIAFNRPTDCPANWLPSPSPRGGTPGQVNAVDTSALETTPPTLFSVRPLSSLELSVQFSETVTSAQALDPARYQLSGGLSILTIVPAEEAFILVLDGELKPGTVYELTISHLSDCLGNNIEAPLTAHFGLPEQPQPGDLLINELLFHPQSGGDDFLELYNASAKIIELEGLLIRNTQKTSGAIQSRITTGYLLFPGKYLVLTDDPADIRSRYLVPDTARILANDLPTLDSDAGNVTLYSGNTVLDAFDYSDNLHHALLDNARGVSLERLSPMLPTQAKGNWHSASAQVGFATPGYRNSQYVPQGRENSSSIFTLTRRTFSPDEDGFEDVLLLDYQTGRVGYLASIRIFDAEGRPVRELARNQLLATEGRLKWDGSRDSGERARTGIYLLWIEVFTPEGDKTITKEYCVLASRF